MGFAVRRSPAHGRADTRRDRVVEEVEVEADVHVGVGVEVVEGHPHRLAHPHLVEVAHVEDLDLLLVQQPLLPQVDVAEPDLAHVARVECRHRARELDELLRSVAGEHSHRHPVQVAGGSDRGGVVVGVRVEPQQPHRPALLAAVPRHGTHRADRETVVTAQHDRHPTQGHLAVHRVEERVVPLDHLGQVPVAVDRRRHRVHRARHVTAVLDRHAEAFECFLDSCQSQGARSEAAADHAGADVGGNTDQAHVHVRRLSDNPGRRQAPDRSHALGCARAHQRHALDLGQLDRR